MANEDFYQGFKNILKMLLLLIGIFSGNIWLGLLVVGLGICVIYALDSWVESREYERLRESGIKDVDNMSGWGGL